MFRGISNVSLDAKGRLAMPAKYHELILESAAGYVVITVDHLDKCLLVYPLSHWEKVEKSLMILPNINR